MSALNPGLFPRRVWSLQEPITADSLESLHPAEREVVANAVESRRREFATGRRLARVLLRELGFADAPLLPDAQRAPQWPSGAIGSISHSDGWCSVAVAPATEIVALGIDVESTLELEERLWDQVLGPDERRPLIRLPPARARRVAMQVFCAKEALFKAQHPLTKSWLGFEGAAIELAADGSFTIGICDPELRREFEPLDLSGAVEVTDRITAAVTFVRRSSIAWRDHARPPAATGEERD